MLVDLAEDSIEVLFLFIEAVLDFPEVKSFLFCCYLLLVHLGLRYFVFI